MARSLPGRYSRGAALFPIWVPAMSSAQTSQASDAAPSAPRKVDALLAHYGQSHRNPRNELIQYIAIPLIMFSLVGMMFSLNPVVAYGFMAASLV